MSRQTITLALFVVALVGIQGRAPANERCESLAALKLPTTAITLAQTVGAGKFVPPHGLLVPPRALLPDLKSPAR